MIFLSWQRWRLVPSVVGRSMNVLFLDDSPERRSRFTSLVPHGQCVETAQECIDRLASQSWDVVFLDHDLGGEAMMPTTHQNSGSAVVRWMIEQRSPVRYVVVHSLNSPAATGMVSDLKGAGYAAEYHPWGWQNADAILAVYDRLVSLIGPPPLPLP